MSSQTWRLIQNWSSSNWVSWKTSYGDYWLQCEMKTSDNQVKTKTITYSYVAGKTKLTGTNISKKDGGDGTYLLGCVSENTNNVKYSILIYDLATTTWRALVYQNTIQWIDWAPETGDYWVQFEVYTSDGRRGDIRKHAVSAYRPVRRALILGETSTAQVPIGDVDNIFLLNENSTFNGNHFISNTSFANKTKTQIINKIRTTFANTTDNDVSYLYFTCHGGAGGTLLLEPHTQTFTPAELRSIIDQYIKGTVVIMIDSCHAGGNINKEEGSELDDFNNSFVQAFTDVSKTGELVANRFKVLCSSRKDEVSYGGSVISAATRFWTEGAGWDSINASTCEMLADTNNDGKVTLKELYNYSYDETISYSGDRQHIVCSPENDVFVIYGRY